MSKNITKRCAEGDCSSRKKSKHTHTSANEHHDDPCFLRSPSPESDISEQPCDRRNFTGEIRVLRQHIDNMEKEANAYQLHFKGYRDCIQSLERETHDRHTRLNALQNKVDKLEAEAKDRRILAHEFEVHAQHIGCLCLEDRPPDTSCSRSQGFHWSHWTTSSNQGAGCHTATPSMVTPNSTPPNPVTVIVLAATGIITPLGMTCSQHFFTNATGIDTRAMQQTIHSQPYNLQWNKLRHCASKVWLRF
ncbi:hypothetical protein BDR07DRAFT_1378786 [Suillus spraguei]|nr:hypothetical protein BDR07DRAFT_1378786 [Suillus spraguei]